MSDHESFFVTREVETDLSQFAWHMRALLGGDLLAVVAQQPSWPVDRPQTRRWVNVLVLVTDPSQPQCERVFKQHFIRDNPNFSYPVEIMGYRGFMEKLKLGDPIVVYLCRSGRVLYEAQGAFEHLQAQARDPELQVDVDRLVNYLHDKSLAHFRNVRYLLARLLNEIYMGALAGLTRRLISDENEVDRDLLYQAAQWEGVKELARAGSVEKSMLNKVDDLVKAIIMLMSVEEGAEHLHSLPEDCGGSIERMARDLAGQLDLFSRK